MQMCTTYKNLQHMKTCNVGVETCNLWRWECKLASKHQRLYENNQNAQICRNADCQPVAENDKMTCFWAWQLQTEVETSSNWIFDSGKVLRANLHTCTPCSALRAHQIWGQSGEITWRTLRHCVQPPTSSNTNCESCVVHACVCKEGDGDTIFSGALAHKCMSHTLLPYH